MKTAMVDKAVAAGVPMSVADVSVNQASLAVVTEDVSVATPITGAARHMAATSFSTIIALAMALAGHQIFA
jgi:hypothetical protein